MNPPVAMPPSAALLQNSDKLEDHIDFKIGEYLNSWRTEAESAVVGAKVTVEPRSRVYFYVALAGNLVWAGTCLIDPAAGLVSKVAVRAMSFGGAFVGSGTVERFFANEPPDTDSAKNVVQQQLSLTRGAIEEEFKKEMPAWAAELAKREAAEPGTTPHVEVLRKRDAYIWNKMFSFIPYNADRYEVIRANLKSVIESSLADFNRQFEAYSDAYAYEGESLRRARGHYFRPELRFWWQGTMFGPPIVVRLNGVTVINDGSSVKVQPDGNFN